MGNRKVRKWKFACSDYNKKSTGNAIPWGLIQYKDGILPV